MNYTLIHTDPSQKTLNTSASSRAEALAHFSDALGYELTENPDDEMTDYLMDEWEKGPHWTKPHISVFRRRKL